MINRTKKVILFIAEGPTDEETLSPVLKKIFQKEDVRFHIVHGDLTSNWSVNAQNAVKTVNQHIDIERKRYGFGKKDILKVIHLVDMDGAFIKEDQVVYADQAEILYFNDHIETRSPETVNNRNVRKSQILSRLSLTGKIGTIPYSIYYFSRNLEHIFHNSEKNLTNEEKVNYADTFADRYSSNPSAFLSLLSDNDFTVPGDYRDTWEFISQGTNSLNRHSNFHLLFQEFPEN
ncbi:hypothetical protein [Lacrimispora sp.]|uniref:hypothetical protein n=1 Tax=Lacrimispora sp. TaxID=2719234 RepID=UPI0032E39389